MKINISADTQELEGQAMLIAAEIFNLINEYTNDSNVSKFFLTDEVARVSYGLAGGFASVIYTEPLEPKEVKDSAILSFMYALMTYGFNIFLKERSLITNASPYTLPLERKIVKKILKKTLDMIPHGELTSTPLSDKIITIILENVKNQITTQEFRMEGHRLNKKKFFDYAQISLYWGYNFARELLTENKTETNNISQIKKLES